jgi:hypothetical protein
MNSDNQDYGVVKNTQMDEVGEQTKLVGLPNIHDGRGNKLTKWNDGTVEETPRIDGVIVHVDKKLEDALRDADQERVKEL